jgi:hypothetical protein
MTPHIAEGTEHTYNQGVSRVRVPGPGLPPHKYVMISEPFNFFINDDPDGNLTAVTPHPNHLTLTLTLILTLTLTLTLTLILILTLILTM